jgi:N-acyl-D-aspartate/D-glutamate deacylase
MRCARVAVVAVVALVLVGLGSACGPRAAAPSPPGPALHDVVIRGGLIVDGRGGPPAVGDVAIDGDRITVVGDLAGARGRREIDARGQAVAPGFINMLSHSEVSLIADGRSQGELREGVTLEVLGESSMGPASARMKVRMKAEEEDIKYEIEWDTLGGYLDWLQARGIATNVAAFVGAGTVREHVIGLDARHPTAAELDQMRALVAEAMNEGALGVTTALMYEPDTFATTPELIALAREAAAHGGVFTAHVRDEGNHEDQAIDEMIAIAREAKVPVEIFHFKQSGKANWGQLDALVAKIEAARAAGLAITADMYTYPAAETGLDASMPRWVQEGGLEKWRERLKDPAIRARVAKEMDQADPGWDNAFDHAGPAGIKLVDFKSAALRPLIGKTLAEVAAMRGTTPEETAMDLVIEDDSRVGCVYFLMSEDNVRREIAISWMSFGSDEASMATEGVFLHTSAHPRAYGNFARLLGKYVRDEQVIGLAEAVRRLTSLPAANLHLDRRGALAPGFAADVVVFDPATIADHATFDQPHQYATGVAYVLVNGVLVIDHGEHTGATPGRIVRGPGYLARMK